MKDTIIIHDREKFLNKSYFSGENLEIYNLYLNMSKNGDIHTVPNKSSIVEFLDKHNISYSIIDNRDFIKVNTVSKDTMDTLSSVREHIDNALSKYPNYDGIGFFHSISGFVVNLHHKKVEGYAYGPWQHPSNVLRSDMSNADEVIAKAVEQWEEWDNDKTLGDVQYMLRHV